MMSVYRPYRWVLIFALLLLIIGGLLVGRKGEKSFTLETISLGDLVQRIDDFHLTRLKGENVEWEMKAKSVMIHNRDEDASIKDINIIYISGGGTPIKLSAEKGRYNMGANTFFAERTERDVDIKIGHGLTIKGSGLVWLGDKREIHSPGKVQVIGERFVLEGEDLVANLDSGIYEINKNIRATMWE